MAVVLYIRSAFDSHKRIGEIVGRFVIEYGELEWQLCLFAGHIIGDPNAAIKTMYRIRSESQRLAVADALVRNRIENEEIKSIYEQTFAHLHRCRKIRNQYAHTNWVNAGGSRLCFVKIEEIAESNRVADTLDLTKYHLTLEVVTDQQRFIYEVAQNLTYLNFAVQGHEHHFVENIQPPLQALPLD